jgi:CubicO group peptidase (beta-lactamase class C family)
MLREWAAEAAAELEVPGVAVGVLQDGEASYAFHGVTSIEHPLPVDEHTLFQFGSTGKTYTATAMMILVEQGLVDLDAPVRTYVPELRLRDADVAERVTVLQLFNHTAGWQGDLMTDTGWGDDALERYVTLMADIEQVSPLGGTASYNNASLSLAGRIIEKLTGKTYEQAIKEMLLEPLGMDNTFFFPNDIMTRRFVAGHNQSPEGGTMTIARPWAMSRGGNPAGGMSANAADQIAWARFHLGDGRAPDGTRILSEASLERMQEPTVHVPGSAIGDAVGISWLLREVEGVRFVGHGGTTNGQLSDFVMVPERNFAVISMTNSSPNGHVFNERFLRWAYEHYFGIIERDPVPVPRGADELAAYTGVYETIAVTIDISADDGGLALKVRMKPETIAQLREAGEDEPPDQPPIPISLLPGDGDRYVVTGGVAKGMLGYFVRDPSGAVTGAHIGGRFATRATSPSRFTSASASASTSGVD